MTRIVFASTTSTNAAMTTSTMSAATERLLFDDEGGRALDLDDLDPQALVEHLIVEVGPCGPLLAADPHAPAERVDAADDAGAAADERVRSRAGERGHSYVAASDRTDERERRDRPGDEDEEGESEAGFEC